MEERKDMISLLLKLDGAAASLLLADAGAANAGAVVCAGAEGTLNVKSD